MLISVLALPIAPVAWQFLELLEIGAALGLLLGLVMGTILLRHMMRDNARVEEQLRVASGAFMELLTDRFTEWGLTKAEKDVALFSIKGLSTAEIAEMRKTSEGTVKAQTNAIYKKAGVSGRAQLLSLFIDDLFDETLLSKQGN
nr:helix-turn-helix transcriptional regulator [Actibacterium pelagium]